MQNKNKFINMDITYKPYIRDSAFEELSIKTPTININGYKPKYNVDHVEEEDIITPVESQIEEIRTPEPQFKKQTTKKFKSKKEFQDTMTPIYESMLIKRGLNPTFAKALVAQDGLESAWGSKPSGNFNFGGIKGKGTTKRTREVVNGKDIYINDSFRDFNSLEDYVNYKINLLNNNRYQAFSGDVSEFADRVHKGGYATDPNYSRVLNKIIASAKHGGVLKFQQGGITQGKEWVKNWYKNRRPQIKNNIQQNLKIPVPVTGTFGYNLLAHNMDLTTAVVDPSKLPENVNGVYKPWGRKIYLKTDSPSSAVHEWVHSSRPDPQVKEIDKIKDILGDSLYDQKSVIPDEYLDDSQEIYSRLMQLRHALNIDPNHQFTNEEIEELKRKYIKQETLTNRLKGEKDNSFSTTVFDNEGKVVNAEPYQLEYKYTPEESTSHREYDEDNTFQLLNRYSTDSIRRMLNDVAQVPNKKKNSTLYIKLGLKIPKYQEPWNVLPEQIQSKSFDPNWKSPLLDNKKSITSNPEEWDIAYNNINTYWKNKGGPDINQQDFVEGYKLLRNYGFSKDYTNAILANWFQESKFTPNIENKSKDGVAKYVPQFMNSRLEDYESFMTKNDLKDGITTAAKYLINKYDSEKQYWEKYNLYNKQYDLIRSKFAEITGDDSYQYYASGKGNYNPNSIIQFNKWLQENNLQNFELNSIQNVPREENAFGKFIKLIKDNKLSIKHYDPSTYITGIESVKQFHDWFENAGDGALLPKREEYWNILMGNSNLTYK